MARAAVSGSIGLLLAFGRDYTTKDAGQDSSTSWLLQTIERYDGKASQYSSLRAFIQIERHLTTPQYHVPGGYERQSVISPSIILECSQLVLRNDILETNPEHICSLRDQYLRKTLMSR